MKSTVIGARGDYIPYPSHSILTPLGPAVWLLMLDCRCVDLKSDWLLFNTKTIRAERKLGQVCSKEEYGRVFKKMYALPRGVKHVIVQIGNVTPLSPAVRGGLNVITGIPIVYPRMGFLETMLSSKFNPLVTLGRSGSLGLKGFVNKFNGDAELLDDLVLISFPRWRSKLIFLFQE